jgi:small GTP-binding protein
MNHPKFAVVGHPNKGKSSIVSSLVLDDTIAISKYPGTTQDYKSYFLKVDNKIVYELIDTPGFQRAREVLDWLKKHDRGAINRVEVLKEFVEKFQEDKRFYHDIAILKPILQGAGIIYVVDASKPYTPIFEQEMEILRYSSMPSIALLNYISSSDYSKEWKIVLNQYFKIIKTFNPMHFSISKHIELLEAIVHLNEDWNSQVKEAIFYFKKLIEQKINLSAALIANLVKNSLSYVYEKELKNKDEDKQKYINEYKQNLINFEKKAHKEIIKIWEHKNLKINKDNLELNKISLFSKEAQEIFGLSKQELIYFSAALGAVVGGALDLALLGHTLLLGSAIGGAVGAISGYLGFEKFSEIEVLGVNLGKNILKIGPIKDDNFGFILLNRALYFTKEIVSHSHANRKDLQLSFESVDFLNNLQKKEIFKLHKKFKSGEFEDKDLQKYQSLVKEILLKVLN